MTAAHSSINQALPALTALVAMMLAHAPSLMAQAPAADATAAELKWTPHRASRPAAEPVEPQTPPAQLSPLHPAKSPRSTRSRAGSRRRAYRPAVAV